jgi:hypothetical protein
MAKMGIVPSTHPILCSAAGRGNTSINSLRKGSVWYNTVFLPHVEQGYAANNDYALQMMAWAQGEREASNGVESTDYYFAALNGLQSEIEVDARAIASKQQTVFLATYQLSYFAGTNKKIATAQLLAAQQNSKILLASPTYGFPYADDNVHLTNVGSKWLGAYYGRLYAKLVAHRDGKEPLHCQANPWWIDPISATRIGNVITFRAWVPKPPLVIDPVNLAPTTDDGFRAVDSAGTVPISSIVVNGSDTIITLSAAPVGDLVLRYGYDYLGLGLTINNGASGNLRDSTEDVTLIDGVEKPLYHLCPHFELPVILLGE